MNNDIKISAITSPIKGEVIIPSDKSISHRAIILGSLTGRKNKNFKFFKRKRPNLNS